ncbi:MAG: sulfatase-like hydrolase/transferase [Dorea sp.]|nr:sulfatase-like hydrolase/transferase [Dorea sp.]
MQKVFGVVKKVLTILGTALAVLLMALATIIYFSIQWMFNTWSNLTMDELMFHLTAPLDGTNESMIKEYLSMCVAPTVLVLILTVILFITWHKKKMYFVFMGVGMVASLAVSASVVQGAWNKLDAGSYVKAQGTYSTFIDDNYVDPADVILEFPQRKRNLIYIFLESMETTYTDQSNGGAFRKDVIPELTKLAQENEDFSGESSELNGGLSMPGTTWTMGAMFAQTSGLPLNIALDNNDMDTQDAFFPGIITMGDILDNAGYRQSLMIGSDATFGGRRLYFSEHGNYEMYDYNYAKEMAWIPEDYKVWWGYEDQKLFDFAKEKILEIANEEEPFNFTLLTVDTHFEDGYVCDICRNTFREDQYANVMACSSRQVEDFVKWIQMQSFYENTTIVLVGDHPTMDSDFCEDVDEDYVRKVYTSYINPAAELEIDKERYYTTFDIFPTTLASLGVKIKGERLGLGTNLFSGKQTLTERFGSETEEKELERKSELMEKLAALDKNKQELLTRKGKYPKAVISVEEYRAENAVIPVRIANFENIINDVAEVSLSVWTAEDQSDMQWIQMSIQEDGSYYADIDISIFGYKQGEYSIHAYIVDSEGDQYRVAEAIGAVY